MKNSCFIAITGSLGKTTTTRALKAVLFQTANPREIKNAAVYVALDILRTHLKTKHAVFETGIDGPGQMVRFAQMIRPQIVVVTSIASDHHTSLGALENTRNEKAELVRILPPSGVAVLNADDPNVMWMKTQTNARIVTFGFSKDADVRAESMEFESAQKSLLCVHIGNQSLHLKTKLVGKVMMYPILAAIAVSWLEGLNLIKVKSFLESLDPTPGRLQTIALENGATILCDHVKSHVKTVGAALDTLRSLPAKRRIAVIGMLAEISDKFGPTYRWVGEQTALAADKIIFIGTKKGLGAVRSGVNRAGFSADSIVHSAKTTSQVINILRGLLEKGDLVLINGSGNQKLQRIMLTLKGHTVSCNLKTCTNKLMSCDRCPMLERGWDDGRTAF